MHTSRHTFIHTQYTHTYKCPCIHVLKQTRTQDWNIDTGFPKRSADVKDGQRAGYSVIRDAVGYEQNFGKKEVKSDLYIPRDMNSGEILVAYRQHIIDSAIAQAELWLKTHKQEEAEAERKKILAEKLEVRRKLREEQAIADELKRIGTSIHTLIHTYTLPYIYMLISLYINKHTFIHAFTHILIYTLVYTFIQRMKN